ncbi:VanZ family protein [Pseudomonas bubulae]|uniref:VanZ family protein n=1 Tax=Pseudomonas bubulae TaxID=2316085 RepID=UPI0011B5ED13|nr:VanZ family protein [Pseudomonas bubulae]
MRQLIQRLVDLPFWLRALLFLAVCAGLLFTGLRTRPIPQVFAQEDKLHHFMGFFALAFSCRLAFLPVKLHWIAIGCVLAGVLIEYAQALIPLRTASFYDALANTAGVALGLLVAWHFTRHEKRH